MKWTIPLWEWLDGRRQYKQARTLLDTQAVGRRGEDAAHRFLQRKGYRVVARNWRSEFGWSELDLIAWDGNRLVVVEVKSRTNRDYADPGRNVDRLKLIAMRRGARELARQLHQPQEVLRFDLVRVVFEPEITIDHEVDAYSLWDN